MSSICEQSLKVNHLIISCNHMSEPDINIDKKKLSALSYLLTENEETELLLMDILGFTGECKK